MKGYVVVECKFCGSRLDKSGDVLYLLMLTILIRDK